MSVVKFYNIPHLPNDYSNVMTFKSKTNKLNYFKKFFIDSDEVNIKPHPSLEEISLNRAIDDVNLMRSDYIIIDDTYFFFIIDKEVINTQHVKIHLQLDVWTTYHNDIQYLTTLIDRCHQNRDVENHIVEDLPLGQYFLDKNKVIKNYNNGLIIASTEPLGLIPDFTPPSKTPILGGDDSLALVPQYVEYMDLPNLTFNGEPGVGGIQAYGPYVLETYTKSFSDSNGFYYKEIKIYYKGKVIYTLDVPTDETKDFKKGGLCKNRLSENMDYQLYIAHRGTSGVENIIPIIFMGGV